MKLLTQQAMDTKSGKVLEKIKDLESQIKLKTARYGHSLRKGIIDQATHDKALANVTRRCERMIQELRDSLKERLHDDTLIRIHQGARRFNMKTTRSEEVDATVVARFGPWKS